MSKPNQDFRPLALESKSLDELEGSSIASPYQSGMVESVAKARRVALKDLTPGQLRLLLTQRQGVNFIFGLVVQLLERDPWIETDYYSGDLLRQLVRTERATWPPGDWTTRVRDIFENALKSYDNRIESDRNVDVYREVSEALQVLE
jgi:hypothetical protein